MKKPRKIKEQYRKIQTRNARPLARGIRRYGKIMRRNGCQLAEMMEPHLYSARELNALWQEFIEGPR